MWELGIKKARGEVWHSTGCGGEGGGGGATGGGGGAISCRLVLSNASILLFREFNAMRTVAVSSLLLCSSLCMNSLKRSQRKLMSIPS